MSHLNLLIPSKNMINIHWPKFQPLLERGLADSEGEFEAVDLLPILLTTTGFLLLGVDDTGDVHTAIALQIQSYPRYTVAHIFSIGGRWVLANRRHWADIKAWLKLQGASKVQGSCKPAQARLWRQFGMEPVYTIVRQDL